MTAIKHILLDLDGTLTNPKEGITKSIQYALTQMNVEIPTMDELEWCIGPPLSEVFATLLATKSPDPIQQAITYYRERYHGICEVENIPYVGIATTLAQLKDAGFELYLATSKPWVYAEKILKHFNLHEYFTKVHGSELDGTRDYKHDLIAFILEQNKLNASHCMMVGDRLHDVIGAKHNQLYAVGVTYGFGTREELEAAGADHLCDEHKEFLAIATNKPRFT